MKTITIRDPMYFSRMTLMYSCNQVEVENYVRKQHDDYEFECFDDADDNGGFAIQVGREIYLWIDDELDAVTPWLMGVIAHETNHATFSWLRHIGIAAGEETEEAHTYLQQFYVERITRKILLNALKKKQKAHKKKQ